jgi:hypothetical protein
MLSRDSLPDSLGKKNDGPSSKVITVMDACRSHIGHSEQTWTCRATTLCASSSQDEILYEYSPEIAYFLCSSSGAFVPDNITHRPTFRFKSTDDNDDDDKERNRIGKKVSVTLPPFMFAFLKKWAEGSRERVTTTIFEGSSRGFKSLKTYSVGFRGLRPR